MYLKNSLISKYGLKVADLPDNATPDNFVVTEEMIEKYKSGEWSLEDILPFALED